MSEAQELKKEAHHLHQKATRSSMCGCLAHCLNDQSYDAQYVPSSIEELLNWITHGVPAVVAIVLLPALTIEYCIEWLYGTVTTGNVVKSPQQIQYSWLRMFSVVVYALGMISVFSISSLYHLSAMLLSRRSKCTQVFVTLDHAIIFIFIAASYTPWLLLMEIGVDNWCGLFGFCCIWAISLLGIVRCTTSLLDSWISELKLYLLMGWFCVLLMFPLSQVDMTMWAPVEIILGGILFSAGTGFFSLDGKLPFSHAWWHLMVTGGIILHFHAIHTYLWSANKFIPRRI